MEIERALQQLELLQKKLYAYHCADSSLYLDAVTTGHEHSCRRKPEADDQPRDESAAG